MKKVNIKKHIKQIIAWMILVIVLAFSVSFSNARKDSVLCKHIRINIKGNEKNSLITKEEISTSLEDKKYKLKGYPLFRINTKQLEEEMEQYPQIKEVEIYAKMDSSLNFEIYQRNPVVRIMKQDGEDFFIDEDGVIISVINNHPSHVLLANGHIGFNLEKEKAVFNITDTIHKGNEIEVLKNLYQLAVFIDENQFWKHQIEQIYVNKDKEFEIIPRVGAHFIHFGSIDQYEWKFKKLKYLYKKGFSKEGWNKYEQINLKYKNQIICTKR